MSKVKTEYGRGILKGIEFRLGYAAGCRDTINHLFWTGQLK